MQEILEYGLLVLAGLTAGIINTLAGNGSLITLSAMFFLGIPADIANATNRVGVMFQSVSATLGYRKQGIDQSHVLKRNLLPVLAGAVCGTVLVLNFSKESLSWIFGYIMLLMLGVVLLNPKKWLREKDQSGALWKEKTVLFFAALYGGFLQAGVGILLLSGLVQVCGYSLKNSNGIKIVVVMLLTIPALSIFVYKGMVDWKTGLTLAVGQTAGAWVATKFLIQHPKANVWIRRLLIVILCVSIFKLFGLAKYF